MSRLLVINPGSTSTKIAVYEDEQQKWMESISHSPDELAKYAQVYDQLDMRGDLVKKTVEAHNESLGDFDVIVSRGGNMPPVHAGAYEVNEPMLDFLEHRPQDEHPSNAGPGIAYKLAREAGIKAYTYDPVSVDEMLPLYKVTGCKGVRRPARGHNLNMRAAALKLCETKGLDYKKSNLIVAHLGGGITVSLHCKGRIIDMISDDEGPFSPERAGGLPYFELLKIAYGEACTHAELLKSLQRKGGMMSHFGTSDIREIEQRIDDGDEEVKLVFEAMALNVGKNIAKLAVDVAGKIDFIVLTGGIAFSDRFTSLIEKGVLFIAPVEIIPGEKEMDALALGISRVLSGEEKADLLTEEECR
jgi:butyrate kinase